MAPYRMGAHTSCSRSHLRFMPMQQLCMHTLPTCDLHISALHAGAMRPSHSTPANRSTQSSPTSSPSSTSSAQLTWPQLSGRPLPASELLDRAKFEVMVAAAISSVQRQLPNMSSEQLVEVLWCLGRLRVATPAFLEVRYGQILLLVRWLQDAMWVAVVGTHTCSS